MKPESITAWSAAAQAFAAVASLVVAIVLVWITHRYMKLTKGILEETGKAREAAEKQATVSQQNLELLKREYESRLGEGPKILADALRSARTLIDYWEPMARVGQGNPHSVPDPAPLGVPDLISAQEHARTISPECCSRVSAIIDELKCARSEFERIRQSYRGPSMSPSQLLGAGPTPHLERAKKWIDEILPQLTESKATHA